VLDTALFIALIVASRPALTGIGLHEWLAGLIVIPSLYHLAVNRDWVVRVASRLSARLKAGSHINFAVDAVLFIATVTVMLSGVMVLPGMVSTAEGTVMLAVWLRAHALASDATVIALLVHLFLHAGWMTDVARRALAPKRGRRAAARQRGVARESGQR
jgi:predicted small integral membrane protein